jgi:hypothetical protein
MKHQSLRRSGADSARAAARPPGRLSSHRAGAAVETLLCVSGSSVLAESRSKLKRWASTSGG